MPPKEKSNPLSIGNLVPAHRFAPALHGGKQLDALIEELQRPRSDWRVLHAPLEEDDQAPLAAPAFTCVVGMPTAVGVLKIASGAGSASACTLFVRLKRSVLDAWCTVHGKDNWSRRAFSRKLDAEQATILLGAMQPHCLKEGQVHHPQALSVLCLMSLGGWLTLANGTTRPPTECGSFTLVGLPPADPNFEQCLTLLGHRSTFKAQAAAGVADSDDENTPSAHRVDPDVWGKTHGTTLCPQWVPKFQEAARVFSNQADPNVFSQHVPALNKHAPDCVRVLDKARTLFALDAKAGNEEAKAPPPPPPPGRKRPPERVADSVALAPSDPSDNENGSDSEAEAAAPTAANPAATAGPSSSRKDGKQTQRAQKKRKGRAADEESGDEEQESMTSACSSSEEDEDDGEEDVVDADASERATSDDEDDGDAASSSSSVGAAKAPRKQKARAKKRRVAAPAPPPVADATRMTAAEAMLAVKETALCSAMREIAAQSYEDVWAWRDGGRAPAMAEASACQA